MTTVSLAVITFNEQHNILPLLNNVYDMFDEIVIADGCSTDKTIKVVDDFRKSVSDSKIKLYIIPQQGIRYARTWNQAAQRNLALNNCSKEWVFTIDADERLGAGTRDRLEKLMTTAPDHFAFAMPTYHYWGAPDQIRTDKYWYPNYHYRCWKNHLGILYSRHQRHCYPMIKKCPEVRKELEEHTELPYADIPIHHYHHCPIKKSGTIYRANFKDVRTLQELLGDLQVRKVGLREKMEREIKWDNEH